MLGNSGRIFRAFNDYAGAGMRGIKRKAVPLCLLSTKRGGLLQ